MSGRVPSHLKPESVPQLHDPQANRPQPDRSPLPLPLRLFAWSGPVLWLACILDALLHSLHRPDFDGFHWLFYRPAAFDFWDYIDRFALLHRPDFFTAPGYPWYYPAPVVFLLHPLYRLDSLAGSWLPGYLAYVALALGGFLFVALRLARRLRLSGVDPLPAYLFVLSATLFSWPLYFALQRGNLEALTWLFLAVAIWAWAQERWLLLAVLLGIAASFKLYPAVCFALFLPARRFKELAVGLLTFALSTVLALRAIEPSLTLAWHGTRIGITRWVNDYACFFGRDSSPYDHSSYELLKVLTRPLHPAYPALLRGDLLLLGSLALVGFFARAIRLPRTNQLLYLVTIAVVLPPASMDYTLLNLYVPLGWLALALVAQPVPSRRRAVWIAFLLFAWILGPESFLHWGNLGLAGLLKSLPLLGLLVLTVISPLPDLPSLSIPSSAPII